jgi:hypothetical protein
MLGKCAVCGKETEVIVCCSAFGAVSYAYCNHCLINHLEPYDAMVADIACAGRFPDDINQQYQELCRHILNELGISETQFISDVDKTIKDMDEEYAAWCEENENKQYIERYDDFPEVLEIDIQA